MGENNTVTCEHTSVILPAVAATCTTDDLTEGSRCSVCNKILVAQQTIPATGHSLGNWYTHVAATCTENGTEKRDCSVCDYFVTRVTAAQGHAYQPVVTLPTFTAQGYTTYTCTSCGDSYKGSYTDALGHRWIGWTWDGDQGCYTNECDTCGAMDYDYDI